MLEPAKFWGGVGGGLGIEYNICGEGPFLGVGEVEIFAINFNRRRRGICWGRCVRGWIKYTCLVILGEMCLVTRDRHPRHKSKSSSFPKVGFSSLTTE